MSKPKQTIRLKEIRKELGYTQEKFAEIMKMSLSGYKKLESGEIRKSVDKLFMLNERLGLSADYVLYDEKPQPKDVWIEVCKLPDIERWRIFLRLYSYLSNNSKDDAQLDEMMKKVDKVLNEQKKNDKFNKQLRRR